MAMLDDFRNKEFLDQITILNEISGSKDSEALPELVALLKEPVGDTSIDYMVVNALNAVLSANEDKIIEGLSDDHDGYKILCIRVAGEYAVDGATPSLVAMAEVESDPDRLMEIITSLARIANPQALPIFRKFLDHDDPFIQSACIEALGKLSDEESVDRFKAHDRGERGPEPLRGSATSPVGKPWTPLAGFRTEDTIGFLVKKLHHKNPMVRRIITDAAW